MEVLQFIGLCLSLFLNFCNVCIMIYVFKKFLSKPQEDLKERVIKAEGRIDKIENSLKSGNDEFRQIHKGIDLFFNIILSFIDFETAYCIHTNYPHTEDLKDIKLKIKEYVSTEKVE